MRVLVTGANGHIGSWVARAAVKRGWQVVGLVREGADLRGLAGVPVELKRGDLLDAAAVKAAVAGVDAVLHVGAVHRMVAAKAEDITQPAVLGTKNVLEAMAASGVKKLVYTSTAATVGFAKDPARPLDEGAFNEGAKAPYVRGKIEAERLVLAAKDKVGAVILNPSGVFGPGDLKLTPATRGVIGMLQGDPAMLGLHLTDVRDVAEAHALALEKGEPGTRTIIVGDALLPKQLSALVNEVTGIKPPTFRPPDFLLRFVIGRVEKKALAEGGDSAATVEAFEDLQGGHLLYDGTRSRKQLGMSYRPGREVLTDAARWLLAMNALKPGVAKKVRAKLGAAAEPDPSWPRA